MKVREFHSELWLPKPLEALFSFFADPGNLEVITPDWLHFKILTRMPMEIRAGSEIDYRLLWHGIPFRWKTRITAWHPPYLFVDEQIRGPYSRWIHTHTFEEKDEGTTIHDAVNYATPFDTMLHRFVVRPDIEKIFAFRASTLKCRFGALEENPQ